MEFEMLLRRAEGEELNLCGPGNRLVIKAIGEWCTREMSYAQRPPLEYL